MRIDVTQEIINESERLRPLRVRPRSSCCPVALALQAAGFPNAAVGLDITRLNDSGYKDVNLPPEVATFIWKADTRHPVEPFSFELDLEAARVD